MYRHRKFLRSSKTSLSKIRDGIVQKKKKNTRIVCTILFGLIEAGATIFNAQFPGSLLWKHAIIIWGFGLIIMRTTPPKFSENSISNYYEYILWRVESNSLLKSAICSLRISRISNYCTISLVLSYGYIQFRA
ncbi:hypothetical protein BT93_F3307 [Corymbia citriodora subsp. variegata]|nr:hypothetical protein BT93_F3307 [Corymbia citriodora subsp. variegata]